MAEPPLAEGFAQSSRGALFAPTGPSLGATGPSLSAAIWREPCDSALAMIRRAPAFLSAAALALLLLPLGCAEAGRPELPPSPTQMAAPPPPLPAPSAPPSHPPAAQAPAPSHARPATSGPQPAPSSTYETPTGNWVFSNQHGWEWHTWP